MTKCPVFLLLCLTFFFSFHIKGQEKHPKREFRAVWVATINNIDWPSSAKLSAEAQKEEFRQLLDGHLKDGMNTVIVQVRPAADAFYVSNLEPWSQWLTGKQGVPPQPYYDPMAFMIEEAHARNMEFHAWLNPFRAVANINTAKLHDSHITLKKPEWFLNYGILKMFDPGIPEARDYIIRVIVDMVQRYDLDGIHFDDYFYPYPDLVTKLPDTETYKRYGKPEGFKYKMEWRRENINRFIEASYKAIKAEKPWVKFGVSPFGVWRNLREDPRGSDSRSGYTCYDHLHADVRLWQRMQWVDYMSPQLYQNIKHKKNPFLILTKWWNDNAFGRHIYIGHAAWRVFSAKDRNWHDPHEISNQVRFTREQPFVLGSTFYSSKSLRRNQGGIRDSLRQHLYTVPALIPTMPWLDSIAPTPPPYLTVSHDSSSSVVKLTWQPQVSEDSGTAIPEMDKIYRYAIYRFPSNETQPDFSDPTKIKKILPSQQTEWIDTEAQSLQEFQYYITAFDRLHNESEPVRSSEEIPLDPLIAALNIEPELVDFLARLLERQVKQYFDQP